MERLLSHLKQQKYIKRQAVLQLEKYTGIARQHIWYEYVKGNIERIGKQDGKVVYLFTGHECLVQTNDVDNALIEFGPKGETLGFDVDNLTYGSDKSDEEQAALIRQLTAQFYIKRIDPVLYPFLKRLTRAVRYHFLSWEEEADVRLADRYILLE